MVLSWLDGRAAKEFGKSLATDFAAHVPLEATNLKEKKFASRTQGAMRQMSARVVDFKSKETLNVYKKAKLCNTFKWTLRDAGYGAEYIEKLTDWLVTQL